MTIVETELKSRGIVLAEERTDLAVQRTVIAAERTLMAWIRTAISMIGFGFSIYKFFQYQAEEIAAGNIRHPQAPPGLAAQESSERDRCIPDAARVVYLLRGRAGCHPDWSHHVLQYCAATRAVLVEMRLLHVTWSQTEELSEDLRHAVSFDS